MFKAIKRGRGPWMRVLAETFKHPQEVWEQWEWIASKEWMDAIAAMAHRRHYLAWWDAPDRDQPGLSVFEWAPKRWWTGVTTFAPEPENQEYIDLSRAGRRRWPK